MADSPNHRLCDADYDVRMNLKVVEREGTDSSKWSRPKLASPPKKGKQPRVRSPLWRYYVRESAKAAFAICLICWNWTQKALSDCTW